MVDRIERIKSLQDLIKFARPLEEVRGELRRHEFDSLEPLAKLDRGDVVRILERFLRCEITAEDVEEWAEAIELRDDIEVSDEELKEAIFDLANPVLQGALTALHAEGWIRRLT